MSDSPTVGMVNNATAAIEAGTGRVWSWLRAEPARFDLAVAALTTGLGVLLIFGRPDEFDAGRPEVVAGAGAFVLVLLRRRWPVVLLAVSLVWAAAHVAIWDRPTPMIFAIIVLLITVCIRLERWAAIGLGASIALSLYIMGLTGNNAQWGDARALIGVAWSTGAVGIADAIRSWRRYRESADAQVRSAVLAAEAQSRQRVSEERLTIARELHDLLAHNLSVMNVQTGTALHLLRSDPDQAEASLTVARNAGRSVLDELGGLLSVLRDNNDGPSGDTSAGEADDGVAPTKALPSIERVDDLVEAMRSTGLAVNWSRSGNPRRLTPAASLAAYRIMQEALTNAAKHGPGSARLETTWSDDGLSITVANRLTDPAEAARTKRDTSGGGHGLIGMRERALVNGGRLTAEQVGGRFVVEAWLPKATGPGVAGPETAS